MRETVLKYKLCAILRGVPTDKVVACARAIYDGGIRMFEVALNSEDACEQIRLLREHLPEDVYIGAGTAITIARIEAAMAAGANFLLTPSVSMEVLTYCRDHGIQLMPGVMTPSEVDMALSMGFSTCKLFPAGDLPMSYVKSLKGPFDGTDYVAVGGVNLDNVRDFFKHGFIGVGIGSCLTPKDRIQANDWAAITEMASRFVQAIQ